MAKCLHCRRSISYEGLCEPCEEYERETAWERDREAPRCKQCGRAFSSRRTQQLHSYFRHRGG